MAVFMMQNSCLGVTYYVDCKIGNNSHDGITKETPWRTLSKVEVILLVGGDSLLLKRGCTWNEDLIIGNSGVQDCLIVVGAYGEHSTSPRITGAKKLSKSSMLDIEDTSREIYANGNLYIKSCEPCNGINECYGTKLDTNYEIEHLTINNGIIVKGDYIKIQDIHVDKFRKVGIKVLGKNCIVSKCIISDIPQTGLQFIMADSSSVLNTSIIRVGFNSKPCCKGKLCGHLGNGIFISWNKAKSRTERKFTTGIRIIGNTFKSIGTYSGDHGIYDNGHNTIIYNNTFSNVTGVGIKLDGENSLLFNNLISNCKTAAILIDGGNGHEIYHNSILRSGLSSRDWGVQGAIWYMEQTKQKTKHPKVGGATIMYNQISYGKRSIKIQNSYGNLTFLFNKCTKPELEYTNSKPLKAKLAQQWSEKLGSQADCTSISEKSAYRHFFCELPKFKRAYGIIKSLRQVKI